MTYLKPIPMNKIYNVFYCNISPHQKHQISSKTITTNGHCSVVVALQKMSHMSHCPGRGLRIVKRHISGCIVMQTKLSPADKILNILNDISTPVQFVVFHNLNNKKKHLVVTCKSEYWLLISHDQEEGNRIIQRHRSLGNRLSMIETERLTGAIVCKKTRKTISCDDVNDLIFSEVIS